MSDLTLIEVIANNAQTVDQDAVGIFDVDKYAKSDYTIAPEVPVKGKSIVLFDTSNVSGIVMRMFSSLGITE